MVGVGLTLLYVINPAEWLIFPRCLFHQLTGWNCPGCGATRAAHALLHGDFIRAFRDNAILVVMLPGLMVLAARMILRRERGFRFSSRWLWIGGAITLAFGVWRNLPAGAWFNP